MVSNNLYHFNNKQLKITKKQFKMSSENNEYIKLVGVKMVGELLYATFSMIENNQVQIKECYFANENNAVVCIDEKEASNVYEENRDLFYNILNEFSVLQQQGKPTGWEIVIGCSHRENKFAINMGQTIIDPFKIHLQYELHIVFNISSN